jgi:hypothetical protein
MAAVQRVEALEALRKDCVDVHHHASECGVCGACSRSGCRSLRTQGFRRHRTVVGSARALAGRTFVRPHSRLSEEGLFGKLDECAHPPDASAARDPASAGLGPVGEGDRREDHLSPRTLVFQKYHVKLLWAPRIPRSLIRFAVKHGIACCGPGFLLIRSADIANEQSCVSGCLP